MIHLYLTGPDGSGKTSLMEAVKAKLIDTGKKTEHVWLRSPKITSKPLMAWCRLSGLTRYETINGIRYGAHEFYRSKWVSKLFPSLQLVDFKIRDRMVKKAISRSQKDVILYDRYSLDTLADLMADTGRWNLPNTNIGRQFRSMLPKGIKIVSLSVKEETIRKRKQDTLHDPHLDRKIKAYDIIAREFNLTVIDNNRTFNEALENILRVFKVNEGIKE